MLPSDRALSVEDLRQAVRRRVAESSLRVAAEEIGLSFKGVDKFLNGAEPHPSTRRKLTDWYVRRSSSRSEAPTPETIQAALELIVRHLPPAIQARAAAAAVAAVRAVGTDAKVAEPDWMAEVSRGE